MNSISNKKNKRVWNLPAYQVYSLATLGVNKETNMNICSYVTAFSMKPKMFAVAIYKNTQTYFNLINEFEKELIQNKESIVIPAILQIFNINQKKLVRALGYKSGKSFAKQPYLEKHTNLSLAENNISYISSCSGIVLLEMYKLIKEEDSDHDIALFRVVGSKSLETEVELLTTDLL